jgi:hypothetical protein
MKEIKALIIFIIVIATSIILYKNISGLTSNHNNTCLECLCNNIKSSELTKLKNNNWNIIASTMILNEESFQEQAYYALISDVFNKIKGAKVISYDLKEYKPGWKISCIILLKNKDKNLLEDEYEYFKR